jgi:endonuclease/exonuclease/phosphatase family metal-dependent hydrolase
MGGRGWARAILAVLAVAHLGCEPLFDPLDFDEAPAPILRAREVRPVPAVATGDPAHLTVVAYNIKYAARRLPFWFDCWGDRVAMDRATVDAHLADLARLIHELDPDVLMIEEVEVNSRRSAHVNMVQALLDRTRLNYAAYFRHWRSRYVPADGLGRMDLGMAILTKHPIREAKSIRLQDRTDLDALTRAFYIRRVVGRAEVELPGQRVAFFVVHTEAYDVDGTKQRQLERIDEILQQETLPFVVGGDFNELPPTAARRVDFADERTTGVCGDDFAQPPYTPEAMAPFYAQLEPWIPLARLGETEESQRRYYTHSVLGPDERNEAGEPGTWTRTLDYLFASPGTGWVAGASDVVQRAGQQVGSTPVVVRSDVLRLSDHAPVIGVWEVRR